jgi:DNA polymerase I-like protein with 3'-5' exonuclease and polymerase domains
VEYKDAVKRLSTYGLRWTENINPITGRIHADFLIAESEPGRFSCRNPNLQQLPRDERFRSLVKAGEGKRIIVADYSQIELRTVALLSGDSAMLDAYEKGEDLHRKTASAVSGIEPDKVSKAQRQMAKAINFGLIFGMSAATLVTRSKTTYNVDMTLEEAEKAHKAFFVAYPRLKLWQTVTAKETKRTLKSRIEGGLIRQYTPETYSYTEALNTPVQGSAAMAMLAALPKVEARLKGLDAKLINLIHDEIVLEVADIDVEAAKIALSEGMTEGFLQIFPKACTRDLVEAHDGANWQEAK